MAINRKGLDPLLLKTKQAIPIIDAIQNLNIIEFLYSGPKKYSTIPPRTGRNPTDRPYVREPVKAGKRVKGKPVAIGISKRGNLLIRIHVEPPSVSRKGFSKHGWRTFMLSRMRDIKVLKDKNFSLSIPKYNGGGPDDTFVRTLLFITPKSVAENSKTVFELKREERLKEQQRIDLKKISDERKEKAIKELKKKKTFTSESIKKEKESKFRLSSSAKKIIEPTQTSKPKSGVAKAISSFRSRLKSIGRSLRGRLKN
jgi:hypothetical protein